MVSRNNLIINAEKKNTSNVISHYTNPQEHKQF